MSPLLSVTLFLVVQSESTGVVDRDLRRTAFLKRATSAVAILEARDGVLVGGGGPVDVDEARLGAFRRGDDAIVRQRVESRWERLRPNREGRAGEPPLSTSEYNLITWLCPRPKAREMCGMHEADAERDQNEIFCNRSYQFSWYIMTLL